MRRDVYKGKEINGKAKSPERKPCFCLPHGILAALLARDQLAGPLKDDKIVPHVSDLAQEKL